MLTLWCTFNTYSYWEWNWCDHFGKQFGNIHKICNAHTLSSSNYTSQNLSYRCTWTQDILCSIVYSSNSLESLKGWLIVVHPKDRILYSSKILWSRLMWNEKPQKAYGTVLSVMFLLYFFTVYSYRENISGKTHK